MKRTYTAWAKAGEADLSAFCAGEEPPRLANGEAAPDCDVVLWRAEAATWEEAMAIRNLRCGFAP